VSLVRRGVGGGKEGVVTPDERDARRLIGVRFAEALTDDYRIVPSPQSALSQGTRGRRLA
jgi:hypothetical protein